VDERKKLAEGAYGDSSSHGRSTTGTTSSSLGFSGSADTSAMIEKEKHKLEVLKRRQERDIQQVGPGSRGRAAAAAAAAGG
jgi:hypothetical protein